MNLSSVTYIRTKSLSTLLFKKSFTKSFWSVYFWDKNKKFAMDVEKLSPILKSICVATNGAFVGAAFYVLSVDFPSLDEHSYGCVLKIMRLKHKYHKRMQAGLAVTSGLLGVTLYFMDKEKNMPFLLAGSIMLSTLPFSALAIRPTSAPLVAPGAKDKMDEPEVREKMTKLRRLLSIRCLASLTAFGYLVYHLTA